MKHALPWKVNRKKWIEKKGKGGKKVYVEQETIENDINFTGGIKAKLSELWKAFFVASMQCGKRLDRRNLITLISPGVAFP